MIIKKTKTSTHDKSKSPVIGSTSDLGKRIGLIADHLGSRKYAAEVAGISVDQLARYINGESQPSLAPIALMAAGANVSLEWLATGEGPMRPNARHEGEHPDSIHVGDMDDDAIAIPEYIVEGSAGHGVVASAEEVRTVWYFSRKLAREMGLNPANLVFIKVVGDSMEPNIGTGDLVLVDRTNKTFKNEGIYVFVLGDMLLVKRIQMLSGGEFQAKSDNPAYSPITIREGADSITIVGRVLLAVKHM